MLLYCCLAYLTFVTYLTYSVIVSFFRETYFCLALITFLAYLSYLLVIFLFKDTFEFQINPPATTPVTWSSSTTTVVNPTPAEDLWPGHPTWNTTTWNTPTVKEAINNVVQQFAANHPNGIYWPLDKEEDLQSS
ncbi:hypothetical protein PAXINDRAFT_16604 [Paxillus involutus ATCC 200175]|uniref:Uncharacterized protein n=1 Tax=Paxillus involutus ATCC 200175 TaxID=664439 RepID=A0A0C9TRD7_PAXIN|nr:hypothetical protein PAXINDRAFT_16604 [Paxillus involutus ATCC 200175]